MSDLEDFVESYITSCVEEGAATPKQICDRALAAIAEIDKELATANGLRAKKKQLNAVLRNFEHESVRRHKRSSNAVLASDDLEFEQNPLYVEYATKIYDLMEKQNGSITPREIMDSIGGLEQNQLVYMVIKSLCDKGVLTRNEDRSLVKGENWENRIKEAR